MRTICLTAALCAVVAAEDPPPGSSDPYAELAAIQAVINDLIETIDDLAEQVEAKDSELEEQVSVVNQHGDEADNAFNLWQFYIATNQSAAAIAAKEADYQAAVQAYNDQVDVMDDLSLELTALQDQLALETLVLDEAREIEQELLEIIGGEGS